MELWAVGRYDLQLNEEEFWRLTLKEFNMLCNRHKNRQSAEAFNSALICSVIANVNRRKGKAFEPADFMPKEKKKRKKMNMAQMLEALKSITAANGGAIDV